MLPLCRLFVAYAICRRQGLLIFRYMLLLFYFADAAAIMRLMIRFATFSLLSSLSCCHLRRHHHNIVICLLHDYASANMPYASYDTTKHNIPHDVHHRYFDMLPYFFAADAAAALRGAFAGFSPLFRCLIRRHTLLLITLAAIRTKIRHMSPAVLMMPYAATCHNKLFVSRCYVTPLRRQRHYATCRPLPYVTIRSSLRYTPQQPRCHYFSADAITPLHYAAFLRFSPFRFSIIDAAYFLYFDMAAMPCCCHTAIRFRARFDAAAMMLPLSRMTLRHTLRHAAMLL